MELQRLKEFLQLNEAEKPVYVVATLAVTITVFDDDGDEVEKSGKRKLAILCDDQADAERVLKVVDDNEIDWQQDHDDLLHHIASNSFNQYESGASVDAYVDSVKIVRTEQKTARNTFFANSKDFK